MLSNDFLESKHSYRVSIADIGKMVSAKEEKMLSNDFLESRHSYRISAADMDSFLKECEEEGLRWSHGLKPTEFDPFKFYEGENIKYLVPIQRVDDMTQIYIKCFYGKLHFSFCYDWSVQPGVDYKAK